MLLMPFMFYRAYSPKNDENSRAFCESTHARISSISIDLLEKFQATNERTESALNQYFLHGYTEDTCIVNRIMISKTIILKCFLAIYLAILQVFMRESNMNYP